MTELLSRAQEGSLNRQRIVEDVRRNDVQRVYFRDLSAAYQNGSPLLIVDDVSALNNQISNLLTTDIGSRHFEPTFGSRCPTLVWEPCDEQTSWLLETAIIEALQQWMGSRIKFTPGDIRVFPVKEVQAFDAVIQYEVRVSGLNAAARLRLSKS